jgi:hypothetical protein
MSRWLVDARHQSEINQQGAIISRSDKCMFTKDHRFVRVVELCVYLLVEIHAVSSDFHRINSSGFLLPMENATVEELIGFSS